MDLPVQPPVEPMLARSVPKIPVADGMRYEPKWDGFRCLVFRDGDEVELASRGGKTLTRYFPEVVELARAELPERCVLDGELVIVRRDSTEAPETRDDRGFPLPREATEGTARLDFDLLTQRIHPAASRVALLAERTPASLVAFDLLAIGDEDLTGAGFGERRRRLEEALGGGSPSGRTHVTPATIDPERAARWFELFEGAGLDGVVAKPDGQPYQPGKRTMFKIKHSRTADCVVAGWRWHKTGKVVGSLLLGLYDDAGTLHHVGVSSSFTAARRAELVDELAPYAELGDAGHPWLGDARPEYGQRVPGAPSRWTGTKDLSWQPLRPELVCEVGYEHMEGDRFRHTAHFQRWRPDREPGSCTYEQLIRPVRFDLDDILAE